ncbi:MAG: hypothetical protein WC284_02070 [Candidimonas sp.]
MISVPMTALDCEMAGGAKERARKTKEQRIERERAEKRYAVLIFFLDAIPTFHAPILLYFSVIFLGK